MSRLSAREWSWGLLWLGAHELCTQKLPAVRLYPPGWVDVNRSESYSSFHKQDLSGKDKSQKKNHQFQSNPCLFLRYECPQAPSIYIVGYAFWKHLKLREAQIISALWWCFEVCFEFHLLSRAEFRAKKALARLENALQCSVLQTFSQLHSYFQLSEGLRGLRKSFVEVSQLTFSQTCLVSPSSSLHWAKKLYQYSLLKEQ